MAKSSWKDIMQAARRENFVGRASELQECRRIVDENSARALYIAGVAGIGKTTLLRELEPYARQHGWLTHWLDAHLLGDSIFEIEDALSELAESVDGAQTLLFIDNFEVVAHLEDRLRDTITAELPDHISLAMAGRSELGPEWLADIDTHVVKLGPFDSDESAAFLESRGIAAEDTAELLAKAQGMPIALAIAAESRARADQTSHAFPAGDLQGVLERLLERQMTPDQRRALQVASLAWAVREDVLDAALPSQTTGASRLMTWLAERPYMQSTSDGLQPHPMIRELVDEHQRRTSPSFRQAVLGRLRDFLFGRVRQPETGSAAPLVFELWYLARSGRGAAARQLQNSQPLYVDRPRDDDRILEVVRDFEGPLSADIAAYWLEIRADMAFVLRDRNNVARGFAQLLALEDVTDEQRHRDPIVDRTLRELGELADLREGETARMCRFWFDTNSYQQRSPVQPRLFTLISKKVSMVPGASYGPIVNRAPEIWDARDDKRLRKLAEVDVDDERFGIYSRDWRKYDALEHLRRVIDVAMTGEPAQMPGEPRYRVLSREEFDAAVRDALKNLHHGQRLADNDLAFARAAGLAEAQREDPSLLQTRLSDLIEAGVESVRESTDDPIYADVLRATYLEPSQKQRAIAAALSMSYSTYRRRLDEAVERVVDALWRRELGYPAETTSRNR